MQQNTPYANDMLMKFTRWPHLLHTCGVGARARGQSGEHGRDFVPVLASLPLTTSVWFWKEKKKRLNSFFFRQGVWNQCFQEGEMKARWLIHGVTLTTGCSQFIFGGNVGLTALDILQLAQGRFLIRLLSVVLFNREREGMMIAGLVHKRESHTLRQRVQRSQRAHCCVSSLERLLSIGGIPSSCKSRGISRLLGDACMGLYRCSTSSEMPSIVLLSTIICWGCFFFLFFFFFFFFFWFTLFGRWVTVSAPETTDVAAGVVVGLSCCWRAGSEMGRKRWMKPDEPELLGNEDVWFIQTLPAFFLFCFRLAPKWTSNFNTTGSYSSSVHCPPPSSTTKSTVSFLLPACRPASPCRWTRKWLMDEGPRWAP